MAGGELNKLIAPGHEKWIWHYDKSADPMLIHDPKRRVELAFSASSQHLQTLTKSVGCSQNVRNGRLEVRITSICEQCDHGNIREKLMQQFNMFGSQRRSRKN